MSKRPGYILGDHWLETAFDRICAGDREEAVLEDYGWEKKGKWIPVSERLPSERCLVLVAWGLSGHVTIAYFRPDKKRRRFVYDVDGFNSLRDSQEFITHWMPMPEPPKTV